MRSGAIEGLSQDHFWPLPQLNLAIHPDCGAIALLAVVKGKIFPLDTILDMKKYYSLIGVCSTTLKSILIPFMLMRAALKSAKKGKLMEVLKCFYGFVTGRGKYSLLIIAVEGFMDCPYQDDERSKRCASAVWRKEGQAEQFGCICSIEMQQQSS